MEAQFKLQIETGPAVSDEERDELGRQLEKDLRELDLDVTPMAASAEAPAGSKGVVPPDLCTLLVTLAASGGVLTTFINAVESWVTRHGEHSVTLEMDGDKLSVTGVSSSDQQRIIDDWISRRRLAKPAQ